MEEGNGTVVSVLFVDGLIGLSDTAEGSQKQIDVAAPNLARTWRLSENTVKTRVGAKVVRVEHRAMNTQ